MNEQLANALVKAVNEIPAIEKDAQGQRSPYVSLDALLAKIKPVFERHGLTIMQWPVIPQTPGNVAVETIILHESGESISRIGELPMDTNRNMSASQAAGSAYTYLKRYQLSAIGGVVSDPDIDSLPEPPRQQKQPVTKLSPIIQASELRDPNIEPHIVQVKSAPDAKTTDARSWLQGQAKNNGQNILMTSVGQLNKALVMSGRCKAAPHALNLVKQYPDFPEGYDVDGIDGGTEFRIGNALHIYDWAITKEVTE